MISSVQKIFAGLAALLYITTGLLHFIRTELYLRIVPPYIPWPTAMVYISGVAEVLGGLGLLIPNVRRAAAWGLVALLLAVLPANIHMATDHIQVTRSPIPQSLLWARVPLQGILIWWVLGCTRTKA